jgi:hypothetical protein
MNRLFTARRGRFLSMTVLAAELCLVSLAHAEEPAQAVAPLPIADARRAEPDTALAFVSGAAVLVLGMGTGAALIASDAGRPPDNAGWMVIQSSFAAAPLVAHGVVSEWGRGLLFATPPLATTAGTATVFAVDSKAVRHSKLPEQRLLWSLFVVGLFSSAYGVVDSTFAGDRARRIAVAPVLSAHDVGVAIAGTLWSSACSSWCS